MHQRTHPSTRVLLPNITDPIPGDSRQAQESSQDAEHQSHDPSSGEASRKGRHTVVHALEVVHVFRVTDSITGSGDVLVVAGVDVVLGDGEPGGLQLAGGFDECHDETGDHVPFDVAVEEPDACALC